jgi:superfamily I DNA/RNA helicase
MMSRHSRRGLEFPIVAVSEIGSMPAYGEHPMSADNLLYVAMTRSTEKPLLTSHRKTEFLSQLKQVDQVGIS